MIADNRLTESSEWDRRLLGDQFKILSEAEIDFGLEVTGFEMGEIKMYVEGTVPSRRGKKGPADAIPDCRRMPEVTRPGDCWILDRHRLFCGNAQKDSAYSLLMKGRRAEMVFADPPDNSRIDGDVNSFRNVRHAEFAKTTGEMGEFAEFLTGILTQLGANSIDGALHFICVDWRHSAEVLWAARSVYAEFKNICVWVKDKTEQGSLYRSQHELVFVFQAGKKGHRLNIRLNRSGRDRTNVWRYTHVNSLSRSTEQGRFSLLRPTIKPVQLVADAIRDCTAGGDVVLDPFLGSGTTLIASERTGRVCYGIELEPLYVDSIVRRWQAFTDQNAVQESTSRTFNNIEEDNNG